MTRAIKRATARGRRGDRGDGSPVIPATAVRPNP